MKINPGIVLELNMNIQVDSKIETVEYIFDSSYTGFQQEAKSSTRESICLLLDKLHNLVS